MRTLKSLFLDHPTAVEESYLGHMAFALRFFAALTVAAGAALLHAFLPFLCERTASRIVKNLYEQTHTRMPEQKQSANV